MPKPKKMLREGGRTYTTFHVRPYSSKREAEKRAKAVLPVPLPTKIKKEDGGYWAYILTPTNLDDFPPRLKIGRQMYDLHAAFTKQEKATERKRLEERQGRPAKVVNAISLRGATYFAVYLRPSTKESKRMAEAAIRKEKPWRSPPADIKQKWYGHSVNLELHRDGLFPTKKKAEAVKKALREKGEVVQIKPFEGWYALYHTKGFGESHKPEVKYATTMTKVEKHNAKRDGKRRAHPAGKRVSKFGKVYYEYRENRADGPAELEEKWGKEKAGKWAKVKQPKKVKKKAPSVAGKLIAIGGREWTGGAGYHRIYFNNLPELYGLRVSRYKTGSISSASFRGGKISNNKARRIGQAFAFSKLWYDIGSRKFECKGMEEEDKAWIVAEIKKRAKI